MSPNSNRPKPSVDANHGSSVVNYVEHGHRAVLLHEVLSGACSCGNNSKSCPSPSGPDSTAKHPRQAGWLKNLITHRAEAERAWGRYPTANVGLCPREDEFVLDVDPRHGGDKTLAKLEALHGPLDGPCARTGGNGSHHWQKLPPGIDINSVKSTIARNLKLAGGGIDLRTHRHQVVVAPSIHQSGHAYEWLAGRSVLDCEPCVPNDAWLQALGITLPEVDDDLTSEKAARSGPYPHDPDYDLHRARFGLLDLGLLDDQVDNYDEWINVLVALKALDALDLAIEWSRRSAKFVEGEVERKWPGINGTSDGKLFGKFDEANPGWRSAYQALHSGPEPHDSSDFSGFAEHASSEDEYQSVNEATSNLLDASVEAVINRFRQRGPMIHEPTGISGIDDRTGGGPVFGTRFYILGAPDAGKTLLLAQVADTYLQRRIAVGFLASDEDSEDVLQRFLQRRGVTRAECEGQDGPALENALRDVARLPLRIYPRSYTIEQAATDLMAFAEAKGMRAALMMDSLQTIRCNAEDPDASTYVNVTKRVESIREVGTQHKLIAMCTSEMSRGSYRSIRGADQSDMAAGKESGAIEYSARVMVALRSVPKESNMVELRFAKNKHGSTHREGEAGVFFKVHPAAQFLEEDLDYEPPTTTDSGSKQRIEKVIADVALIAVWLAENPGKGVREIEAGMKRVGWGKGRTETARTILTEDEALAVIPSSNNKKLHYLIGAALGDDVLELIPADKVAAVKASTPPVSECPGDTQEDTQESVLSGGVPSPPIGGGTPTTTAHVPEEHESEAGTQGHSVGSSKKSAPAPTIDDGLPEQQKPRRGRATKTITAAAGGGAA